jgi:S-adenosylmethionine hydrolase
MVMREIECDVYNVTNRSYAIDAESVTFQGRDVMAPAVAYLASGVEPSQFGPVASEICKLDIGTPIRSDVCIEGEIISIDRFGNAITNISAHDLDSLSGELMSVEFGDTRFDSIEKTYSSVDLGKPVAYIGSCGLLELAVNGGDFADKFNATVGGKVVVIPDGK